MFNELVLILSTHLLPKSCRLNSPRQRDFKVKSMCLNLALIKSE